MAVQSYSIFIKYPAQTSNNKCKPDATNNKVIPNVDNSLKLPHLSTFLTDFTRLNVDNP